jgi:hypothetical protein
MKEPEAAELLAASGAATPSMARATSPGEHPEEETDHRSAGNGPSGVLPIFFRGEQSFGFCDHLLLQGFFDHGQDFGDSEHSHEDGHQSDAVLENKCAEGESFRPRKGVEPDRSQEQSQTNHQHGLQKRFFTEIADQRQSQEHQRKIFRRAEFQRKLTQRNGDDHQDSDAQGSGNKRTERRHSQSRSGPPLFGHGVTVEGCYDGRRLSGDIDHDGGGGASVLRPIVNPGKHDDGGHGIHVEGDGQQKGNGRGRPQAGNDPDNRAQERTQQAIEQA